MKEQDATILVNVNREEEIIRLLDQTYTELGKAYYEGGFEDPLPELLPIFDRITNLKKELEAEKKEKPHNAGAQPEMHAEPQPAPAAGAHFGQQSAPAPEARPEPQPVPAAGAHFGQQSAPVPEAPQTPSPMPQPRPVQPKPIPHKFCIYCGSPLQPGDVFCSNCGKKIG